MPEDRDVFAGLTVEENLRLAERDGDPRYDLVYDLFPELRQRAGQRAGTLSGGQQQMVAIARALLNRNQVLLVDEPTKGLAPLLVTEVAAVLERAAELTTILLVEQNLPVVQRLARDVVVLDGGRVVHAGPGGRAARRPRARAAAARRPRRRALSTWVLLTITGLGLGAMYFLVASGLSLIYGLMGVLNFAHGALITVGAYAAWWFGDQIGGGPGPAAAARRPLRSRRGRGRRGADRARPHPPALPAARSSRCSSRSASRSRSARSCRGSGGTIPSRSPCPSWMIDTTTVFGANVPNDRFVEIGVAAAVLLGLTAFLRYTKFGLVIRAGVENRAMVSALGIDVRRAFTIVFALGRRARGARGRPLGRLLRRRRPGRGTSLLIFAFIVVVIGGFGSIGGSAIAAVAVGLIQQYANYYASSGTGDLAVVLLLAAVLLVRPHGLAPKVAH